MVTAAKIRLYHYGVIQPHFPYIAGGDLQVIVILRLDGPVGLAHVSADSPSRG
jgi:hypothetical protein